MKHLQELPRRLLWMFAGFGISNFVGIPFVGGIIAKLLYGVSAGSEAIADYITYSHDEASQLMAYQLQNDASIRWMRNTGEGVKVAYDTSAYTGQDIGVDTIEALSEDWI